MTELLKKKKKKEKEEKEKEKKEKKKLKIPGIGRYPMGPTTTPLKRNNLPSII